MKVSVAMCTYNGAKYLKEQLKSIADQTLPPAEIIISDDGSSDETMEIIKHFKGQTTIPVSIYQNPTRLGIIKNFSQAISLCRYDYIALSDQDDVWMHDKLEKQTRFLESSKKNVDVVFSDLLIVDEALRTSGKTLWESFQFTDRRKKLWRKGQALSLLLKNGNVVAGSTLLFRSSFRDKFQPFLSFDYEGWLHDGIIAAIAAKYKRIDFIDYPLVQYRQHNNQATILYKEKKYNNHLAQYVDIYSDFRKMGFSEEDLAYVRNIILHLEFRTSLPHQKLKRVLPVARELFSLRYLRYSRSLVRTAIIDIFKQKKVPADVN